MTVVDDFSDGDISEYTGNTGSRSSVNSGVLKKTTSGLGKFPIYSFSGLDKYPQRGERIEVQFKPVNRYDVIRFGFGLQDTNSTGYIFGIRSDGNGPRLSRDGNQIIGAQSYSHNVDSWHTIRVDWREGGKIRCRIVQDGNTKYDGSANDSTHNSGGISLGVDNHGGQSSSTYFDDVTSTPYLSAPTNVSASVLSNDVSLSWDTVNNASGYNILRAPTSGGSFSQIGSVGSATTSFTDTALTYAEDYAYKIEAYN